MVIDTRTIRHVLNCVSEELRRRKDRYLDISDFKELVEWLEAYHSDKHLVIRVGGEKEFTLYKMRYES